MKKPKGTIAAFVALTIIAISSEGFAQASSRSESLSAISKVIGDAVGAGISAAAKGMLSDITIQRLVIDDFVKMRQEGGTGNIQALQRFSSKDREIIIQVLRSNGDLIMTQEGGNGNIQGGQRVETGRGSAVVQDAHYKNVDMTQREGSNNSQILQDTVKK